MAGLRDPPQRRWEEVKAHVVKIYPNPDRKEDRRILDYLLYAGMPMSKAFKRAMLAYLNQQESGTSNDTLLSGIRQVLREEIQGHLSPAANSGYSEPVPTNTDEDAVSALAFLAELENMAD